MDLKQAIYLLHPATAEAAVKKIGKYNGLEGELAALQAINDACELACQAMDARMAKKPLIEEDSIGDKYLECPNCGCFVGCEIDCEYEPYRISFCHNCGQKIDWSEIQ